MPRREALRAAALAALSAALFCVAWEPVGLWWAIALAPAPLVLVVAWRDGRGRTVAPGWRTYAAVGAVSVAKWLVLDAWMVQITEAGMPALAVYCTAYDLLALWLLGRLARRTAAWGEVPWAVLVPLAFGAVEVLRALILFHGYPWFRWGHPLVEWPALVQGADVVGEVFASIIALAIGGAIADAWTGRARGGAIVAGSLVACSLTYGGWRLSQAPTAPGPGVLAVQTNLETSNKVVWAASRQVKDIPAFADLTLRAAADAQARGQVPALAAWPETMLAGFGLEPGTIALQESEGLFPGDRFQRIVAATAGRIGVPLLVGSPAFVGLRTTGQRYAWDRQFNSAYLVNAPQPPYPRYDKVFLAPFGETMPYISEWKWLEQALLSVGAKGMTFDLDVGGEPVRFDVPWQGGTVRVATPICFEDAMSWVCRDLVFPASAGRERGADLLVNLTNDGWFGWFDGGRAQHLQLARFRCIETRTPMVRVANTGACAGVDSSGRVVALPPAPRTEAWLFANPPLDARVPPFAFLGELGSIAMLTLAGLVAFLPMLRRAHVAVPAMLVGCVLLQACGDETVAQQPWSSRNQSVQPDGQAQLANSETPAAPGATAQPQLVVESSGDARASAVELLKQAARSQVAVFRANAAEALINSPTDLRAVAGPLLADENRGVRFVATVSLARANCADFADQVQPLLLDESPSVRAAAIYALTRFGRPVDPTPLAAMVRSDDPEVRSNAYLVLGELGNKSAVPLIRDSLGKGMRQVNPARVRITEMQAAEALVRLGETDGIEPIRAALFAPGEQAEFTALAAQQAGRLKDDGSRAILMRLIDATGISARPTEVRIGCAVALAQISPQDRPAVGRMGRVYLNDRESTVRGQAALAVAWALGPAGVTDLQRVLFDRDPTVQLVAAKAILVATAPR